MSTFVIIALTQVETIGIAGIVVGIVIGYAIHPAIQRVKNLFVSKKPGPRS